MSYYNLDFSGWSDARKAQRDSIINSANITANMINNKYNTYSKLISTLIGSGALGYSLYKDKQKLNKEKQNEIDKTVTDTAVTGLAPDEAVDPMQVLSATNQLNTPAEASQFSKLGEILNSMSEEEKKELTAKLLAKMGEQ